MTKDGENGGQRVVSISIKIPVNVSDRLAAEAARRMIGRHLLVGKAIEDLLDALEHEDLG